jgi:hypothetical protein
VVGLEVVDGADGADGADVMGPRVAGDSVAALDLLYHRYPSSSARIAITMATAMYAFAVPPVITDLNGFFLGPATPRCVLKRRGLKRRGPA